MATTTLTEQRLCRMWAASGMTEDWWELNVKLHEIAKVLGDQGCAADVVEMFDDSAALALTLAVEAIHDKERRVAA